MLLEKKCAHFVASTFPLKLSSMDVSSMEFVINYSKSNMREKIPATANEIEMRLWLDILADKAYY